MFGSSWRVGRIAGVEIRIDTSWLIIAVLITYNLFVEFTASFARLPTIAAILLALGNAALFFGSVLGHEMAHALVAKRRGIDVRGITLFLFGGATHAKVESRRARDEFVVSLVGPISSLLFAGVFYLILRIGSVLPDPVLAGLGYLIYINVILAVFNLLPGFPLDGGRVLRSAIWHITGSYARATRVATVSGQILGYLLVAVGAAILVFRRDITGLWFAAIGWFLAQAARGSARELTVRRALEDIDAEDVMATAVVSIPADLTLREAAERFFTRFGHAAFPVQDGERTIGVLARRALDRVPPEEWSARTVRDMMSPLDDQMTVSPTTSMEGILAKLQDGEGGRVVVVRDGSVVGIITATDVARWLQRRSVRTAADET